MDINPDKIKTLTDGMDYDQFASFMAGMGIFQLQQVNEDKKVEAGMLAIMHGQDPSEIVNRINEISAKFTAVMAVLFNECGLGPDFNPSQCLEDS